MSLDNKFSKLGEERNNWLLSGEDMLVNPD